jgi:hypothetical protein
MKALITSLKTWFPMIFLGWMVGLPFVWMASDFLSNTMYGPITTAIYMVYFVPVMVFSMFARNDYGQRRYRK